MVICNTIIAWKRLCTYYECTCHYTIIYHRVHDILKINIISQSSSINVQSLAGIAIVVLTRSSYAGLAVRIH